MQSAAHFLIRQFVSNIQTSDLNYRVDSFSRIAT